MNRRTTADIEKIVSLKRKMDHETLNESKSNKNINNDDRDNLKPFNAYQIFKKFAMNVLIK